MLPLGRDRVRRMTQYDEIFLQIWQHTLWIIFGQDRRSVYNDLQLVFGDQLLHGSYRHGSVNLLGRRATLLFYRLPN